MIFALRIMPHQIVAILVPVQRIAVRGPCSGRRGGFFYSAPITWPLSAGLHRSLDWTSTRASQAGWMIMGHPAGIIYVMIWTRARRTGIGIRV